MSKLIFKLIIRFLIVGNCFILAQITHAATYYVSPIGSNTEGDGSNATPWQTITFTQSKMVSGDTFILKDGIYKGSINQIAPPSGSPANYTVVKAENDGKAILDANGEFPEFSDWPINISDKSYIQIEGLKGVNGSSDAFINIHGTSHHIKVLRVGIVNGVCYNCIYGSPITIAGTPHHILVEDTWISGAMRYGLQVYYKASQIILRRVVIRWDYMKTNQPQANFSFYGPLDGDTPYLTDILCQNCIALDTNPGNAYNMYYGGFVHPKNTLNITYQGTIILNTGQAKGTDTSASGWYPASSSGCCSGGTKIENSVAWDTGIGIITFNGNPSLTDSINQSTIGESVNNSILKLGGPQIIATNNLFLNNGSSNSNVDLESYNTYIPSAQMPNPTCTGCNTTNPNLQYILRSTDTGTGNGGVKRGATIEKQYGLSGTLWGDPGYDQMTNTNLWPWPYENGIKADMCAPNNPPIEAYPSTNDTTRGFCSKSSLTEYIWTYLGNPNPYLSQRDSVPPSALTGLR